jgi:branched-chain amino acid transport system ATP-binding protein
VTLLAVRALEVRYGGIRALRGIDLAVRRGEVVCLLGANGAGKTTTLRAIAGLTAAAAGEVLLEGEPIHRLPTHRRVARGLTLVPEGRGVFPRLTVEDNLLMGAYVTDRGVQTRRDLERAYGLFPRLAERRAQKAGTLSGGEQQMLAIARALMARPRLVMLDEPSLGLAPRLVGRIFETLRAIAAEGMTLLLVEQNARLALEIADRGHVLDGGRITLSDSAGALMADPRVRAAYLGAPTA